MTLNLTDSSTLHKYAGLRLYAATRLQKLHQWAVRTICLEAGVALIMTNGCMMRKECPQELHFSYLHGYCLVIASYCRSHLPYAPACVELAGWTSKFGYGYRALVHFRCITMLCYSCTQCLSFDESTPIYSSAVAETIRIVRVEMHDPCSIFQIICPPSRMPDVRPPSIV